MLDILEQARKTFGMEPVATIDARGSDTRMVSLAVEQVIEFSHKPAVFTLTYGESISPTGANWCASITRMARSRGLSATCVNEGGVVTCRVGAEWKKLGQASVWLIPSKSHEGRYHTVVRFNRVKGGEQVWSCDSWCEGFLNRGTCSHVREAQGV